jgi:hypothetical protein
MVLFPDELMGGQRAGLALWLFLDGWTPATDEAAERLGLSVDGARVLMQNLGEILPIAQQDGRWYLDGDECKQFHQVGDEMNAATRARGVRGSNSLGSRRP